jgi:hypothetical protein
MSQIDKKSGHDSARGDDCRGEAGKTALVGLLGGILSAVGYAVYQRLPEEQKERIRGQVRGLVESRINEIRQNFNI